MPLIKSKSKKAFSQNVSEMMHSGHPQKQSLAAAYATKRKAEHKAYGGMAEGGDIDKFVERQPNKPKVKGVHESIMKGDPGTSVAGGYIGGHGYGNNPEVAKRMHKEKLGESRSLSGPTSGKSGFAYGGHVDPYSKEERRSNQISGPAMHSRLGMAYGGRIDGEYQSKCTEHCNYPCEVHEQGEYMPGEWNKSHPMKHDTAAAHEDERSLNQHGEDEQGPYGMNMSEGGMLTDSGYQDASHEMDMVGRIMAKLQKHYSKGGQVANETERMEHRYDPNDFDDLVLRDSDLESADYMGANSGDEDGDAEDNRRRNDRVARIMMKRFRQHNQYKDQVKSGA